MSVNGAVKAGWFLIGLGIGAFSTAILMKRELEKPIGEIEEYIPLEDRINNFEDNSDNDSNRNSNNEVYSRNYSNSQKDISEQGNGRGRDGKLGPSRHNDRKEERSEFLSDKNDVLYYNKIINEYGAQSTDRLEEDTRQKELEKYRKEATKYSRMYKDKVVEEALHVENSHRGSRISYDVANDSSGSYNEDDGPSDDYIVSPVYDSDLHDEFTLERVEENIEIFLDDNPQDFITMIFYEGDNTLCDDGERIVPNAEEVVGLVALSRLIEGGPGAENGVIFVHNLKTSLNYEIVLDAGSYKDTVIGQFESHLNGDGGKDGYS